MDGAHLIFHRNSKLSGNPQSPHSSGHAQSRQSKCGTDH